MKDGEYYWIQVKRFDASVLEGFTWDPVEVARYDVWYNESPGWEIVGNNSGVSCDNARVVDGPISLVGCYINPYFGPQTEEEERIYAEESICVDFQVALHQAMLATGVGRKELASRLQISTHVLNSFLGDRCVIDLRMVAAAFNALGKNVELVVKDKV